MKQELHKPQSKDIEELKIRVNLIRQGIDPEIAMAVIRYRPEDIPFIYQTTPQDVLHHQIRKDWTEGADLVPGQSCLWIGTTDAIHNLVNPEGWNDQIPEVIVQWRGNIFTQSDQHPAGSEITRTEIKHLEGGRFLEIEYIDVSAMGVFDGDIGRISLNIPDGTFRPGGGRIRQSFRIFYFKQDKKSGEWSLDTGLTNVSGTTILNGFQEILNFHLADVLEIKADYPKTRRYSQLSSDNSPRFLPTSPDAQYQMILSEKTGLSKDRIIEISQSARELMEIVAPQVLTALVHGNYQNNAIGMMADGILNHSDKIWIFNKMLSQFSRQDRFDLARAMAKEIQDGRFKSWVIEINKPENSKIVNDVINRNTQHLLAWFKQKAPVDADLKGWIKKAMNYAQGINNRTKPEFSQEYERAFDGMITSFVERYVEYSAQKFFKRTLS